MRSAARAGGPTRWQFQLMLAATGTALVIDDRHDWPFPLHDR